MKATEYELEDGLIKHLLEHKKDFFLGRRGIGIVFLSNALGWKVDIDRAKMILYPAKVALENDELNLYTEDNALIGVIRLKEYLKVAVIW